MSKYTSLVVCTLCISVIGYLSWDLLRKNNADSIELSAAQQGENVLLDKEAISTTSNTQMPATPKVNDVVTLKSEEESSVTVDNTKRMVSSEQFMKNLSSCTASINTDRDYGIFPDDTIDPDLVTLDWNLEIKSGSVQDCTINFGYTLYDTQSVKQVEKITQCTFNFKHLAEEQVRVLYEDVAAAFSYSLTNKMLTLDTNKLSGAETMYLNQELKDLSKIDQETLKIYSEINVENIGRVTCSNAFVTVEKEMEKVDNNPAITTETKSTSSSEVSDTVKRLLSLLRAKAEIHYNKNYTYAGLCSSESVIGDLNEALGISNGEVYRPNVHGLSSYVAQNNQQKSTAACHVNDNGYVIVAPVTAGFGFWCIDSTGALKQTTIAPAANTLSCS